MRSATSTRQQKRRGKNGFERKVRARVAPCLRSPQRPRRLQHLQQPRRMPPSSSAPPTRALAAAQWPPPVQSWRRPVPSEVSMRGGVRSSGATAEF
eukprot:6451650-Pyramimonas_sp.AAC.1